MKNYLGVQNKMMQKKGFGALAQLAIVIFIGLFLITIIPEVKATILEIIKALG